MLFHTSSGLLHAYDWDISLVSLQGWCEDDKKLCSQVKEKTHCIRPKQGITDLEAHRAITKQKLCILSDTCSDLPADVVLNRVHSILLDTSRETTRPRKPPRKKHMWSPAISAKARESKATHHIWKLKRRCVDASYTASWRPRQMINNSSTSDNADDHVELPLTYSLITQLHQRSQ